MMALVDTVAMNAIQKIMDGEEWEADTLDEIAQVVVWSGREVRDPVDVEDEK